MVSEHNNPPLVSFPGRRRNSLAMSVSSNSYFRYQKAESNFRTLSHDNRKTQLSCIELLQSHQFHFNSNHSITLV